MPAKISKGHHAWPFYDRWKKNDAQAVFDLASERGGQWGDGEQYYNLLSVWPEASEGFLALADLTPERRVWCQLVWGLTQNTLTDCAFLQHLDLIDASEPSERKKAVRTAVKLMMRFWRGHHGEGLMDDFWHELTQIGFKDGRAEVLDAALLYTAAVREGSARLTNKFGQIWSQHPKKTASEEGMTRACLIKYAAHPDFDVEVLNAGLTFTPLQLNGNKGLISAAARSPNFLKRLLDEPHGRIGGAIKVLQYWYTGWHAHQTDIPERRACVRVMCASLSAEDVEKVGAWCARRKERMNEADRRVRDGAMLMFDNELDDEKLDAFARGLGDLAQQVPRARAVMQARVIDDAIGSMAETAKTNRPKVM